MDAIKEGMLAREIKISRDTLRKYNHLGDISWKII